MNPEFHQSLAAGVALFNQQEFYEAHEAWEAGWIDEVADERVLLQGLIQVAAGFYKLQVGSPLGTVKLLELGAQKLRRFMDHPLGVDLGGLLPQVEAWREEAERMVAQKRADYDPARLPKVQYTPPQGRSAAPERTGGKPMEMAAEFQKADCPYCGEPVDVPADAVGVSAEEYVEDCPVCCRPWTVKVFREGAAVRVELMRDDD